MISHTWFTIKTIVLLIGLRKHALSHNILTELPIELCELKQLFIDGHAIVQMAACITKIPLMKLVN